MIAHKLITRTVLVFCFCLTSTGFIWAQEAQKSKEDVPPLVMNQITNQIEAKQEMPEQAPQLSGNEEAKEVPAAIAEQAEAKNEEEVAVKNEETAPLTPENTQEAAKPEKKATEWVWGEVVSVNAEKKEIVIQHLDYETYEEVQMTLKADEKTTFENAAQLSDIKPKDHITVDYYLQDGSNMAELIVVEKENVAKEEENNSAQAPAATTGLANEENKPQETPKANATVATPIEPQEAAATNATAITKPAEPTAAMPQAAATTNMTMLNTSVTSLVDQTQTAITSLMNQTNVSANLPGVPTTTETLPSNETKK